MNPSELHLLFSQYLNEDIGSGDHSTLSCIPADIRGKCVLKAKQEGIIAGLDIVKELFLYTDPSSKITFMAKDGDAIQPGDQPFTIEARRQKLLSTERLALNILQRMSGIATETHLYNLELKGTKTRLLDTRKTTPGFRYFEKEAVRIGGGTNHRFGLYDMIMLKDNHIDFAGGIEKAIDMSLQYMSDNKLQLKIEVETRSLDDVKRVLAHGKADRIMLDNFSPELTKTAVEIIQGRIETESSGGITLQNIRDYALCGVDYISIGALTHQIKSLDLSLKALF
ncbi:MAG: nicotinate-nucleotide diphosphorylase (carboxylating) [Bacteroidetes bacterium HGW-Bacteroidetes-21]|jgi:nicotinate-nucleotide pyrophosphorylase (carboxylating)|nr:MAG: nicotinate-nucleotide diphosphorylase (carboxylating) [Bacteroidetes bacterium HGW-Bacteroidetes-21]